MMKRRYVWIGNGFKSFTSYKKMVEWTKDDRHDGTYYISCPDITFKKTREQIIQENANRIK